VQSPTLSQALAEKRILVCVGSGGVGKTTTAAALALTACRRGKRTLVLTIDPAKRLAASLGLAALGHQVQEVDPALSKPSPGGSLYAMMLDQKMAFDEVVARHAKDPDAMTRILANPVYAQISGALSGAQEYAAMAKLHDFDRSGEWDLIVVDTPPTAHALDFLDAPQKLTQAIDSPAIEWFRKMQDGGGWSAVGRVGSFVLKRLARFVGSQFLNDLAIFFTEFNDILGGFRARAEETFALLRQPKVGFVLVASPEPMAMNEALAFHQRLVGSEMPFVGFVVNKVHPARPWHGPVAPDGAAALPVVEAALARAPAVVPLAMSGTSLRIAAEAMIAAHRELEAKAAADRLAVDRLVAAGGRDAIVIEVPFLKEDVHDLNRLAGLGQFLAPPLAKRASATAS
jgi:anion-transporting  ArsA/GET3 family ATPase